MLLTFFLGIFYSLILTMLSGLIAYVTPPEINAAAAALNPYWMFFDKILPVREFTTMLVITFALSSAVITFKLSTWVITLIRGGAHQIGK